MSSLTQKNRHLQITTPFGDEVLLLRSFEGTEHISRLFSFDLDLVSDSDSLSPDTIIGKDVTFRVGFATEQSIRYFNGIVKSFELQGRDQAIASYRAEVVPWFWLLTQTTDCRIFQNKTVPQIIQGIFNEAEFPDFDVHQLQGSYQPREYTVQYRETDFAFISRLLEDEGICYFFKHENGKHTLVLGDSDSSYKTCPGFETVKFSAATNNQTLPPDVFEWRAVQQFRPGRFAHHDYNFKTPSTKLGKSVSGTNDFEVFDYPGGYLQEQEGESLAQKRMEEIEATRVAAQGASGCRAFEAGSKFSLDKHFRNDQNRQYLITALKHKASQGGDYRAGGSVPPLLYENRFECIPADTPFRPARVTPRPVIPGAQTAVVVGQSGEEILTDDYGRVKVQFHWDRYSKADETSSCFIRVAQSSAGKSWGAFSLPRVGQEVVVTFLNGDPDFPLVTGSVYNAEQTTPYKLPGEQTKTVIKTSTSKGGDGFNELRFEDAQGSEQVFLHAERNQDIRVKKDQFTHIGGESHETIASSHYAQIGGDQHLTLKGDLNQSVQGTYSLKTSQDLQAKLGMNCELEAGTEVYVKAGMNLVLESGTTLTLKVGSSFINLNPAGVFISGTMVMVNSGGAAGSGSGASPQDPTAPTDADDGTGGNLVPPKPNQPPKPTQYSPAALVLKQAAQSGAPFCAT
jgi:type VI secretion system secreted protein VgrG